MSLEELRREYARARLDESEVDPDPFGQFAKWFAEAQKSDLLDLNAMALATATPAGRPSARIVLLKGYDRDGFVFFTDYRSRKSQQLESNAWATLLFYWAPLERQIAIGGRTVRVARELAEGYFRSRPIGSQIGAWASHQSSVLRGGRGELEQRVHQLSEQFAQGAVPLPPHWGGWRLEPDEFEFWQGRESRLHDRIRYRLVDGGWVIERLSP
jgi:pyridoxamine 5'-phosphate oxidase